MNRNRDTHMQLPFGAIRVQAFCRRRQGDITYLGRFGRKFKVAATERGQAALAEEFVIEPTGERTNDKDVVTVRARV